ncbi:pentatricopeptide repeat-containing protein At2g22410, mitochondrial-like [Olea europaea var. sylvestris]|uniref:pentatricopeptide repeat-containing protein At2g22410, mitochondrial-like n=1 Tax=Olea europaea var. sylvestris TaxID=158386 RepID=UPI000C1CFE86|nr:pentatricopeptide repeat-containing protein At2g22410, mitochondrial-like [Olea europaea var. sylvestris]
MVNKVVFKKVNALELDRERLVNELQESTTSLSELKLVKEILKAKVKTLTSDLVKSNTQIHLFLSASQKLDSLLRLNKPVRNMKGLEYKQTNHNKASTFKTIFVLTTNWPTYSLISDLREVLSLFREMEELNVKPNESVLISVLTACADTGALAQATGLVDMYSKCGSVELALSVIEDIDDKGSRAWNAIMSGVAMNGDALKSLQLFDKMVLRGLQTIESTFISDTACTHANLVDRGLSLFENMDSVYGVEPHYACTVDLWARSGRLEEAEKFIEEKMGRICEGDANVWGALLAACRITRRLTSGKMVWRKLTNEGLPDYGTHMLSYNMYKEAGLEAEAENVRRLTEERRMEKIPGCSSIEVNGMVEELFAGDLLHPEAQELCKVLDYLLHVASLVQ